MRNCLMNSSIDVTDFEMMQGDTYKLPVKLVHKGYVIKDINVIKIEFKFGSIDKVYPSDDVTYENERFILHFSQAETLSLKSELYNEYQASVLFTDNSRKSTKVYGMQILNTLIRKEITSG